MSEYHNDYSGEPPKVGGGSPYPQKFLLSGNSPAYPPHSLSSGLAVSSGGSHLAGLDGAVGGYSFNDFIGDVAHVGKEVAPDIIRAVALGKGRKKGGSAVGDQIASVFKTIAPFAPLLLGLGHPAPKSKADVVKALAHLGAKKSHSLPKLADIAMKGGYSFNDFLGDVAHVGKEVAPDLIRASLKGEGRKKKAKKGGLSLKDVLESAKPAIAKAVEKAKPIVSDVIEKAKPHAKRLAKKALDEGVKALKEKIGSGKGGKAKRAEIVRKVMKDRGVKMIEASKIVKAEGLY